MFTHARASHFNQRKPSTGPQLPSTRQTEPMQPRTSLSARSAKENISIKDSVLLSRPIATNSRIKQDSSYRKDMYIVFVRNALQERRMGNSDPYDELVSQFSFKEAEGAASQHQLRMWLSALSHVANQFERTHASLVEAVIAMPWVTMDAALVKTYTSFIGILVSARPEYLQSVLRRTIQGFTHQSGLQPRASESSSNPLTRRVIYERLHALLQSLLALVPTLPSLLQPTLVQHFPHKRQSRVEHVTYIRNLLRIVEYSPELADSVLSTIVERSIQVDVEIQVELEDLEADDAAPSVGEVFDLDPFDTLVGDKASEVESDSDDGLDGLSDVSSEADEADDAELPEQVTSQEHIKEMVAKLDAILRLVFGHCERMQAQLAELQSQVAVAAADGVLIDLAEQGRSIQQLQHARNSQFLTLLTIFDRTILRTFKSRYTQFLVFWYTSLDPAFCDLFQGTLASKALVEVDQPPITRAAAAGYLASFINRALFVSQESTRKATALLCEYLANVLDDQDSLTRATPERMVFYAVAQAVFLIFCFRWRDLLLDGEHDEDADRPPTGGTARRWLPELDIISRAIASPLQPLRVCSQDVVDRFARVAQRVGFVYVFSIMDSGESMPVPLAPEVALDEELSSFFPFDPYGLPLSAGYIKPIYREWQQVAIPGMDDDDEEEEDEDEDADEGDGEDTAASLGKSFGGMSISPMHPRLLGRS